ncbi:hypothetical protein LR48_Vigan09g125200 [Vigna angularis]|uniref:Transposase (putative) gypsy type domain-containing protein n=1 Tax=Phaseolus angularis TaxID=3914 RepID=A0A0L9VC62_PHAAN|nr:hypothetical protein LR48_Vigan09g125200 [Vigna angularis]
MSSVSISSSEELAGQGGGGVAVGDAQSPSSVSSFLKKIEREANSGSESLFYGGERIINGMSLFLLKGSVRIDQEVAEPSEGWPRIKGYGWASHDVGLFRSDYSTRNELQWWADRYERVFHGKGASEEDFFFLYTYMFNQLFLRIPFIAFQAAVLCELNVAPTQLHPNGWAAIQAFVTICAAMGITPLYVFADATQNFCFLFSHKRQGEGGSKGRDPQTASSNRAFAFLKARLVVPLMEQVMMAVNRTPPVVDLEPSTGTTPTTVVVPSEKKRKSKEGEKSSSKRSRREGSSLRPIPVGVLDPEFHLVAHMRSHDLQAELDEKKKTSDALRVRVEALVIDHAGCVVKRVGLQAKLDDTHAELTHLRDQLKAARAKADRSAQEVGKLKVKVKRLGLREEELVDQNETLTTELLKANRTISTLNANVVIEHEEGFNKAMRQAVFLLNVDPLASGFDIHQDVFDGKMLPIDEGDDEEAGVDEPVQVDNTAVEDPLVDNQAGEDE